MLSKPIRRSPSQPRRLRPHLLHRPAPSRRLNHARTEPLQIKLEIKAGNRPLRPHQIRNRPVRRSNPASKSLSQPRRLRRHRLRSPTLRHLLNRLRPRWLQPHQRHQLMTTWRRAARLRRVERPGNRRSNPMQHRPRVMPGQGVLYSGNARLAIRLNPARTCSVRRFPA